MSNRNNRYKYRFAFITKSFEAAFFRESETGCSDAADNLNVECVYDGPNATEGAEAAIMQVDIIDRYIAEGIDGIALSVLDEDLVHDSISAAMDAGIPVITFDSDAPNSKRIVYVGTDNEEFGYELGKVLIQLNPIPGTEEDPSGKVVYMTTLPAPNLRERHEGFQRRMEGWRSNWEEIPESPIDIMAQSDIAIDEMWNLMELHPDLKAVVGCCGFNMQNEVRWTEFAKAYPNVTLVNADADDYQINLARRGFVDGLVAQMPYEMGRFSIRTLYELKEGTTDHPEEIGTPALQIVRVPLTLGEADVNNNQLNNLSILAWLLFGIVALISICCGFWTIRRRKHRVVRASQPEFLVMICIGCFIFGSTLIPLSIDDGHPGGLGVMSADVACQTFPWLASIGFTLTFSALFSKTWRVNQVFRNAQHFRRVKVTVRDVMLPLTCLMSANIIVLTVWTILSPMQFVRQPHDGTDAWNRIISTYGICTSQSGRRGESLPYILLLVIINSSAVLIANIQAYQARSIKTEFAESQYIAITVAFIMQAVVIGVPVFALVSDQPQVLFAVACIIIFAICFATLGFIFLPKIGRWRKSLEEDFGGVSSTQTFNEDGSAGGLRLKILRSQANGSIFVRRKFNAVPAKSNSLEKNSSSSGMIYSQNTSSNPLEPTAEQHKVEVIPVPHSPHSSGSGTFESGNTSSRNTNAFAERTPSHNFDELSDTNPTAPMQIQEGGPLTGSGASSNSVVRFCDNDETVKIHQERSSPTKVNGDLNKSLSNDNQNDIER